MAKYKIKPLCTTNRTRKTLINKTHSQMEREPHRSLSEEEKTFFYKSLATGGALNLSRVEELSQVLKHIFKDMPHNLRSNAAGNITLHPQHQVWMKRFENGGHTQQQELVPAGPLPVLAFR